MAGKGGAIERAAKLFRVAPKNAPATKAAPVAAATTKPVERGWERVSGPPKPSETDRTKTSDDMVLDGKAILKSGRKVMWG